MTILAGVSGELGSLLLDLANGVRIEIDFIGGTPEARFKAEYRQGALAKDITKEITGNIEGEEWEYVMSANNLLHFLALARDWKSKKEQGCEKRIHERLDRHLTDMRQLHNLQRIDEDTWDYDKDLREALWTDRWGDMPDDKGSDMCCSHLYAVEIAEDHERESFAISVQKKTVYDIQCSWGGPSDGFLVEVDEGEIQAITYYFKDWYDGARLELSGDAFDTAQRYIEQIVYLGS